MFKSPSSDKLWICIILSLITWIYAERPADVPKIWLPAIFADNMVLQRDKPIVIWGTAAPGLLIKIKLGSNEIDTTAGINGDWSAKLPAMPAGGPYGLSIWGSGAVTFHNVAIGDIWFCAGQSNMAWTVRQSFYSNKDVQSANYPMIRFFKVKPEPIISAPKNVCGNWQPASPTTIPKFSAVAYYFAHELFINTKVPIGIIECDSGGTIGFWMSKESLTGVKKDAQGTCPSITFDRMIEPIIGYGIKGLIWYKGETDRFGAPEYESLLSSMIQDWRKKWGLGDFPCLCVQLPNYPNNYNLTATSAFAQIREAQLQCSKSVPNIFLVVTIDTAEPTGGLHPKNKLEIGHRLARVCLSKVYGQNFNIDSPLYKSTQIMGNKILIHFTPAEFIVKGKEINGFAVAGNNQIFEPAKAHLAQNKNDILVWSDKVKNPIAVKYGWEDNPKINLYCKDHLPLGPFKTDSWTSFFSAEVASYWLKKAYLSAPTPPEVVVLGNEQLFALQGADAYVLNKDIDITGDHRSYVIEHDLMGLLNNPLRVLISALPGALVSDQLLASRALFSNHYKPKLVAITLSPLSFINKDHSSVDTTEAFCFFYKDIGPDLNLYFCQLKLQTSWYAKLLSFFNRPNNSRALHKDYQKDLNQKAITFSPLSWDRQFQLIYPGGLIISSKETPIFQEKLGEYKNRYNDPLSPQFNLQMSCLNSLLSYLKEQQIKAVVFDLPLTTANKKLLPNNFWKLYDDGLSKVCGQNGADFVSLDRVVLPFKENEFADGAHLNLIGGLRLSKTVALFIANKIGMRTFEELLANDKCLL